jgi:hypothetical protein
MISILYANGHSLNKREFIYHLQYVALLNKNYITKPKTDSDLDPVCNEDFFKEYLIFLERGYITLTDKKLHIKAGSNKYFVTELIDGSMGPLCITPQISESPDKKITAFISMYKNKPQIFILTTYGLLIKATSESIGGMDSVFYCFLVWQPQAKGILFNSNDTLHYYALKEHTSRQVFKAPGEYGDEYIASITDYHFISPTVIRFMGGTYLEYSFSGREYEINLDGTDFHKVPGGRFEQGEDLRGGDDY